MSYYKKVMYLIVYIIFSEAVYVSCSSGIVPSSSPSDPAVVSGTDRKSFNINTWTIRYKGSILVSTHGTTSSFSCQSAVPEEALLVYDMYSGTMDSLPAGLYIDKKTGTIVIDNTVAVGRYAVQVKITPRNELYSGSISIDLFFIVRTIDILFKPYADTSEQQYFRIGDIQYPYLFIVPDVEKTSDVSAEIMIVDAEQQEDEYYFESGVKVYQGRRTVDGVSQLILGFGPQMSFVDFEHIPSDRELIIRVHIKLGENIYGRRIFSVRRTSVGPIYTWQDLQALHWIIKTPSFPPPPNSYTLMQDITFPKVGEYGFTGFEPIGEGIVDEFNRVTGEIFSGQLNGNNKTITGLYINKEDSDYVGLFGIQQLSIIKDLTFINPYIRGRNNVGVLAGYQISCRVSNVHVIVENNWNGITISGKSTIGGLVGMIVNQNIPFDQDVFGIEGSMAGNIEGEQYVGGIVGQSVRSKINGRMSGTVNAVAHAGGLIGYADGDPERLSSRPPILPASIRGTVSGAVTAKEKNAGSLVGSSRGVHIAGYSTGDVDGGENAGGLVGKSVSSYVIGYSMGNVDGDKSVGGLVGLLKDSYSYYAFLAGYSTGNITGSDNVGGLVGDVGGLTGIVRSCEVVGFFAGSVTGDNNIGGLIGRWILGAAAALHLPGYWDIAASGTTARYSSDSTVTDGGISSIANVVYDSDNKYYIDTGGNQDTSDDAQIFNRQHFLDYFLLIEENARWPQLGGYFEYDQPILPEVREDN